MKLTTDGCRARQQKLLKILAAQNLDGAVLAQREHVYYFTGHLHNPMHAAATLITADGAVTLAAGTSDAPAVDELAPYAADRHCTMHCQQLEEAAAALAPAIGPGKYGADLAGVVVLTRTGGDLPVDLCPEILRLRKSKHPDEIDAIRDCIRLTEVMYDTAKRVIGPGVDEVAAFSEILAAATIAGGEFLESCGNDFQANAMGGKPRRRAMNAGELYILDAGPCLHGYHADNCRTFAVDGAPTEAQLEAWERIDSVFSMVEEMIEPGLSAVELYDAANAYFQKDGGPGMTHHLGHGIGLRPHEAPELNPRYSAILEVGDVITMEPGLYWDELEGGIRLEENYLVTADGVEKLTSYPRALT